MRISILLLFICFLFRVQLAYSQTIAVDTFRIPFFCDTNTMEVNFEIGGTFNPGNVFTAELSDGSGSFASPTTVGTLTLDGTFSNSPRTISGLLSGITVSDTGYVLRVSSSNPPVTDILTQDLNIGFRNEDDTVTYGDNAWRGYYYSDHWQPANLRLYRDYLGYYTYYPVSIDSHYFYRGTPAGSNFLETVHGIDSATAPYRTYVGCQDVTNFFYDRYAVIYKREGFPCGRYQLDVSFHTREGVKFILDDAVQYQYYHNSTTPASFTDVWQGELTPDSRVIVEFHEFASFDQFEFTLTAIGATSGSPTTSATWSGTTTNWNTPGNWSGGVVPDLTTDVTFNSGNSAYPVLTTKGQEVRSLTLNSGSSLELDPGSELIIYENFVNDGTLQHDDGVLTFEGCEESAISGSSSTAFSSLKVNKFIDTLDVALSRSVTVSDTLNMTAGRIQTSTSNMLTVTTTGSAANASNSSFVEGPMEKVGTSDFIFPVGADSMIAQIGVSNLSMSATFRAEYYNSGPSINDVESPLVRSSSLEYWSLNQTSGTSEGNVTLYWSDTAFSKINDATLLSVARLSSAGLTWIDAGNNAISYGTSGNITSNLVSSDSLSGARFFTFASTNTSFNPLPVSVTYFRGNKVGDDFKLEWGTSYEYRNEHFVIERAINGFQFDSIGLVEGVGNSINLSEYEFYDNNNFSFDNVYYRLKQMDYNGEYNYSNIISFDNTSDVSTTLENDFMVYPNPFDDYITLKFNNLKEEETVSLMLYNYSGKIIRQEFIPFDSLGNKEIRMNTETITQGNYILKVITNDNDVNFMLIKN